MISYNPSTTYLHANNKNILLASRMLKEGKLVAFPTETLYGLGADAKNNNAILKIFTAKSRPPNKPLIVLVRDSYEGSLYAKFCNAALQLAEAFWPGPLTLILNRNFNCTLSKSLNPHNSTISLRSPSNEIAMRLLHCFSGPITAPSANLSGHPSPNTAKEVMLTLNNRIDVVLDGGKCHGIASSLLDLTKSSPILIRKGPITKSQIEAVIKKAVNN